MEKKSISIIIPTFRRSHIITSTINKLNDQSFQDFEIIVVDDNGIGSDEQIMTSQKIKSLNHPNVTYHALETNVGASMARNYGVSKADTPYICFLDDDDFWDPEKLKKQYDKIHFDPSCSFVYSLQAYISKGRITKFPLRNYFGSFENNLIAANCVGGCSNPMLLKSEFLKIGGFTPNMESCQDWDLWYRLTKGGSPEFIPEVLTFVDRSEIDRISVNYKRIIVGLIQFYNFLKSDRKLPFLPHTYLRFKLFFSFINFLLH